MAAIPADGQNPQAIESQIDEASARLADSVEVLAYHATHASEEIKQAARSRLEDTKEQVRRTVAGRLAQGITLVDEKKEQLVRAWRTRSTTPR